MSTQPTLFGPADEWSREDTRDFLTANPLPSDFVWPHRDGGKRPVQPVYRVTGGYGKWLSETPYFPGLFELIHRELFNCGETLPTAEILAAMLRQILAEREAHEAARLPLQP
jgi:hypothetical protein